MDNTLLPRRRALCAGLGLCLLGASTPARAGSYMDRAWLMIAEGGRANDFLGKRLSDRELARLVGQAAEGRLQAAKDTSVPEEVVMAHPHLLLMLEHYERAAAAAALGDTGKYGDHSRAARDEEELFRSVLRQLGWSLPPSKP
jgi:ABC-type hemin transport system substrate-binding protein